MSAQNPYFISRERFVPASAEQIFDLLATPAMHAVIDGSDSVRDALPNGPERLSAGAKFAMDMRIGASYKVMNYVVEFEEGRRIAWRHFYGHIWRYLLQPVDGGTLVTEQWDARTVRRRWVLRLTGFSKRNIRGIERTLEKLDEHFRAVENA
ncbi:SRPBCC family protein [Psychromicrobium sp. YIM B11713]|uniref:SRPBCC family protein n=1 Tax=Psychromicrobium sp. YIM B11713 TaxID=3145233 RepID=UPI00374F7BE3